MCANLRQPAHHRAGVNYPAEDKRMQIVLVTGGAGFIGSHLVEALVRDGYKVRVLDDLSTGSLNNLSSVRNQIEFTKGTVLEAGLCTRLSRDASYVIHLAAIASVPYSIENPLTTQTVNVTGTLNILAAARDAEIQRVVFASSSSVYGPTAPCPQTTGLTPDPASPYAVTKVTGEYYMRVYFSCFGLETVNLRFFNVYGPRQLPEGPYASVIPKFATTMLNGGKPVIEGDGEQTRDFIHVSDCVQAISRAMTAPGVSGQTFNVASGTEISVNELFQRISGAMAYRGAPEMAEARPGDVRQSLADIGPSVASLGFDPHYTLDQGIAETLRWYSDHYMASHH
jgi:nucleoside-diphosphate-sugar epimerase